jgi:hypothetical protein
MNINPNRGSNRKAKQTNAIAKAMSVALLVTQGLVLTAWAAEPTDLLRDKFTVPSSECRGWGRWETPAVWANPTDQAVQVLGGSITVPPSSVVVHPGASQDVGAVWRSPFSGKVSVRGRFAHAHPSGGDGVSWAISYDGKSGRKALAQGALDRGGSREIPTAEGGKLDAIAVEKDDLLRFIVGPRESHQYDSTLVAITVTEVGGQGRVWDLAEDIVADIQESNPHADSLGNAAVWYLVAPRGTQGAGAVEDSLMAPGPKTGRRIEAWTVATDDTKVIVGATDEGQLVIYELSNPAAGWNWTREPAVHPLVTTVAVGNTSREIRWKFKDGKVDKTDGQKATLVFGCEEPALELTSEWWARPGRGPVRHAIRITNRSNGPVKVADPPTLQLDLAAGKDLDELTMWTFHTDGGTPDKVGVYRNPVRPPFSQQIRTHSGGEFIPYAVFDAGGKQGMYVGIEWGYCRVVCVAPEGWPAGTFRVRGGEFAGFSPVVGPGETFESPPGFVGAYKGDVDDAGNGLRRHLFNYSMPEIVRKDPTYPKVQWNAFGATGEKPGNWNSVESKYYPMVDAIAPLGFEEVMLDVGWWKGGTKAPEPVNDPVDWPSGMAKAAEHAHKAGMRFGLYWNKGEAMASSEGRQRRMAHIRRLYEEHKADLWRSDSTGGPVVGASYAEVRGFYDMLDQLGRELPNFQWENCVCGGRIKDFGSMKRAVKVFLTDTYAEHHVRAAFYGSSFALPPAQLLGCVGSTNGRFRPKGVAGMKFAFRSTSLGAPEWFIDAPTGLNDSAPWTDEEKAAVTAAVATYKTRIRPLVRNADLYHILPRPDGKNWDGIQYFDPATGKGVVYLFKPSAVADTIALKLRGVDPGRRYRVSFEDGSNPAAEKTGAELVQGLEVTLKGAPVSELVWIEEINQ